MSNKKVATMTNKQIVDLLTEGGISMDEVSGIFSNISDPYDALYHYLIIKGGYEYYKSIGYMPDVALQKIRDGYYSNTGYITNISLHLMGIEDFNITFNIFEECFGGVTKDEVLEMLEDHYGPYDAKYHYLVVKGGYEYYKSIGYLPYVALLKIREEYYNSIGYQTDIDLHYMEIGE
ncbi:MAG: hypothetical protein IKG56_01425 [Clostridia bacterium]|nr:hypothetical protein [Clostridia bacterium]